MSQGTRRLKDSLLEGYLTEGLGAEARAWVESVLAESEADRARLAELRADSAAFLLKHPPGPLVARYEATQRRRRPWLLWLGPLVAVAAAVLVVVLVPGEEDPLYTAKGSVGLVLYRQRGAESVRVQPGGELAPGDTVRFEVRAERSGYVAVLGRDGAGQVTVYYPYGGQEAVRYDTAAPLLPTAIELDEVRGEEVVYALHSPQPFALGPAVEVLQRGEDLTKLELPGVSVGRTGWVKR